jgi:NRPS condensation-like uncharacterized protein
MKNKQNLSGNINITSSLSVSLDSIKKLSKKVNSTINDIVIASVSSSLYEMFKEKNEVVDQVKLLIPANIRFSFYPDKDSVKLENKFAAIPLAIPVVDTMSNAYDKIRVASAPLRNSFSLVYAYYAVCFWTSLFLPRFLISNQIHSVSNKFTMAFTNTPGPLKPFIYKGNNGVEVRNLSSQSYAMVSGYVGMALCVISQSGRLNMSL